ncbi:tRNA lysidine(34) synthetase TilS [Sphingomonas piscis]|uniref:tRNA(Ile)-lysidine synthase n=1 Tax=Sphingomonas piscis TaxID=2714943 RepID=A0A6G7YNS5_9SPHN|nr:tRNA lysidine(34) synthetase TilS [Sphingomonas piscis]QIK78392.1 tRNA lysidine(34) synthetase TilS [Sphingomonas piscis]
MKGRLPEGARLERFRERLRLLLPEDRALGIAVSGGSDSMALLLLAAASGRPVEAATVDHRLREESSHEASWVGERCGELGIPHVVLEAEWAQRPASAVQEQARDERYRLLGNWAARRSLSAILVAHHADDQAETLLMRLARGAGVRGLAGMREVAPLPGRRSVPLIRPLLTWRKSELEAICSDAGITPRQDLSNVDAQYERPRVRHALAELAWLSAEHLGRSAAHLAAADEAIEWATDRAWNESVRLSPTGIDYTRSEPVEVQRRILLKILGTLGTGQEPRGAELSRMMSSLEEGGTATLRGVLCSGGRIWRFEPAPPRKQRT